MGTTVHLLTVEKSTEMSSDQSAVRSWQGCDLTADWSLPISVLVWVRSFIESDLFDNNTVRRKYHSDLSDQSGLEIRVSIRVRLKSCTILAFLTENNENEHLIFREFHGR